MMSGSLTSITLDVCQRSEKRTVRFGFLANASNTHFRSMAAVAIALQQRGHKVIFFQVPDFEPIARGLGLDFHVVGQDTYPSGSMKKMDQQLGMLSGLSGLEYSIRRSIEQTQLFLEVLPEAIQEEGIDVLVIDDVELYAFTLAERLCLPYVTLSMALPVITDDTVPPYFTTWPYSSDPSTYRRNRRGNDLYLRLTAPLRETVDTYRERWGLPPRTSRSARRARLVSVSQLPQCFDFPRIALSRFHYTAPFGLKLPQSSATFPWEQLDGRRIVYASFGTVMSRPKELSMVVEAAENLGFQAVVVCGGADAAEIAVRRPGHIVVQHAPQLELLKHAAVTVTHGGLNTVLESLAFGVPILAVPFINDQAGVAARVRWQGVGDWIKSRGLSISRLRTAMEQVAEGSLCSARVTALRDQISRVDGPVRAADLIEEAIVSVRV